MTEENINHFVDMYKRGVVAYLESTFWDEESPEYLLRLTQMEHRASKLYQTLKNIA